MDKLSLTTENQLMMMEKYRLTAEEVFVINLLFLASSEEGHKEYLVKYFSLPITQTDLRDLLTSLQNKGVIIKQYKIPAKGKTFDPESVTFNQLFLHNYRKFSGDLGIEFFKAFPVSFNINGLDAPLRNYSKKFATETDFHYAYGKAIGWNLEKHKEILELLQWAKDNNCGLLNMNIADFVASRMWDSLAELKNGGAVMRFDTLKDI